MIDNELKAYRHFDPRIWSAVELWGKRHSSPIGISPIGVAALARYHCDLALVQAATENQIPFILSGSSTVPLEAMAEHALGFWYQGYLPGEVERLEKLVLHLEAARIEVLVVTIDIPVGENRETNERNRFVFPLKLSPRLGRDGVKHPVGMGRLPTDNHCAKFRLDDTGDRSMLFEQIQSVTLIQRSTTEDSNRNARSDINH